MKQLFQNKAFFICYLIFITLGAALLLSYSKTEIFLYINQNNHYTTDYFFRYFTNVGDGIFYAVIVIGLLFYKFRYAIIAGVSFAVSSGIAQLLKRLVFTDEYRPTRYFKDLNVEYHVIEGVKLYSNNSFPSGHATTAFSIFCLLSIIFINRTLGIAFFTGALLASYSRIYLSQHFFADVYFGSLIGVFTSLIVYYVLNNYFDNLNKQWPDKKLKIIKN